MVSFSDHDDLSKPVRPKHTFTFINGNGDTRKFEVADVTEAWIALGVREDAAADQLIDRGWRVKFK